MDRTFELEERVSAYQTLLEESDEKAERLQKEVAQLKETNSKLEQETAS